ncbi:MAG: hypothetical protein RLZZ373_2660 [Pseudomonadota bacterium]|jgi:SpoVK/Ycf46/Vps4 family AAA+-type ATPase
MTDALPPQLLPDSLLDRIGAYGAARRDGELERLELWTHVLSGIKDYASAYAEQAVAAERERCSAETIEAVMRERAMLISWNSSHGLTADETERLDWLNAEARRLSPRVSPEMTVAVEAIRASLAADKP